MHVTVGGPGPEPSTQTVAAMRSPGPARCVLLLVLGLCGAHSRNVLLIVGECFVSGMASSTAACSCR